MSRRTASPPRLTVVCDLDGTLVDTAPDLCGALDTALIEAGIPAVPFDAARLLVGQGALALVRRGIERTRDPCQYDVEHLVERFLDAYRSRLTRESVPYPGVRTTLAAIAGAGHSLAVCTNKPVDLARRMLRELELGCFGDAVVGTGSFGFRKPDPRTLEAAVALAGGEVGRAVMIGDSRTDVETARNAGVPVVLVTYGYRSEPLEALRPDFAVEEFSAVAPIVERLASALGPRASAV